jgi:hypothetical protein
MTLEKILQDGVLGIVVGIVTSALLFLLSKVWNNWALPSLEAMRYAGVKIDGSWYGSGSGEADGGKWSMEITAQLTQQAHSIGGTYHYRYRSPENSFDILYSVKGQLWEGYLNLMLAPVDRRVTSASCLLLKVAGGGAGLVGKNLFRDVNNECVAEVDVFLDRTQNAPS